MIKKLLSRVGDGITTILPCFKPNIQISRIRLPEGIDRSPARL
ncbi:MAG: hypothetical protein AB1393_00170 [Candidatus Edwardsbacteria bacterium]